MVAAEGERVVAAVAATRAMVGAAVVQMASMAKNTKAMSPKLSPLIFILFAVRKSSL